MRCNEGVSRELQSAFPSRRSAPNGFLATVRVGCRLPKVAINSIPVNKPKKSRRRILRAAFPVLDDDGWMRQGIHKGLGTSSPAERWGAGGGWKASARLRFNSRGAQARELSASRATTMPASCIASVSSRSPMATVIDFAAGDKYGIKSDGSSTAGTRETLVSVANLIAWGELVMPLAAIYPFASSKDAYAELARRKARGKIGLALDSEIGEPLHPPSSVP